MQFIASLLVVCLVWMCWLLHSAVSLSHLLFQAGFISQVCKALHDMQSDPQIMAEDVAHHD